MNDRRWAMVTITYPFLEGWGRTYEGDMVAGLRLVENVHPLELGSR